MSGTGGITLNGVTALELVGYQYTSLALMFDLCHFPIIQIGCAPYSVLSSGLGLGAGLTR
jgi:hypothetical protein